MLNPARRKMHHQALVVSQQQRISLATGFEDLSLLLRELEDAAHAIKRGRFLSHEDLRRAIGRNRAIREQGRVLSNASNA